jgi:hypothetical protein
MRRTNRRPTHVPPLLLLLPPLELVLVGLSRSRLLCFHLPYWYELLVASLCRLCRRLDALSRLLLPIHRLLLSIHRLLLSIHRLFLVHRTTLSVAHLITLSITHLIVAFQHPAIPICNWIVR